MKQLLISFIGLALLLAIFYSCITAFNDLQEHNEQVRQFNDQQLDRVN